MAYSAQPAALDPALAYSVEAAALIWNVYTPPLTYRHVDGAKSTELVPGLAESQPRISRDGRRYTFRLRARVRYSDGRRVRASDVKRAIERTLYLTSPGSHYFDSVRGVGAYVKAKDPRADLAGVRADDATREVSIQLTKPDGTFRYALASSFAAPVPPGTRFERLTNTLPPATGAFRFAKIDPGREIVLRRNDQMPRLPHVPPAKLDRITVKILAGRQRQAQQVRRGQLDYMFDPLPVDLLSEVRRQHRDRYAEFTTNSTLYFWLNSSVAPFDNQLLRRAVHLGLDKLALARLYGGMLAPSCNFLPPGMPGYREFKRCPFGAPEAGGDVAAARAIVERQGAAGAPVQVWGHTLEPNRQVTEAFAAQLAAIGFKPRLKLISPSLYFELVGTAKPVFQAGIGAWFQEYPHPASFFDAVRGDLIRASGNYNYSRTDVPELTAAIKRLRRKPELTPGARRRWAALDERVVNDAGVIPFGHSRSSVFMSERMDFARCSPRHLVYITDFSRFCVR